MVVSLKCVDNRVVIDIPMAEFTHSHYRMVWRVWRERFSARQALKDMDTQANLFRDQGLVIKVS